MTIHRQQRTSTGIRKSLSMEIINATSAVSEENAISPSDVVKTPSDRSRPGSKDGLPETQSSADEIQQPTTASSGKTSSSRLGIRSTSSKFSSLRDKFESKGSADGGLLEKSKRRLTNNSERTVEMTAEQKHEYTTEIARLKDELEKEKELRVAYEDKVTTLEEEVEELREALEARDEEWRTEFETRSGQLLADAESRLSIMTKEARSQENVAVGLQKQLAELKHSVAASTKVTAEVSDTTFQQEFGILHHELQNFLVTQLRRVKFESSSQEMCAKLEKVAEIRQFELLKPVFESFNDGSSLKIPIFQAVVSCYIMDIFQDPYLFGLTEQRDWGKRSRQAADALKNVLDHETWNRLRSTMLDALRRSKSIEGVLDSASNSMSELICIVLTALTGADASESWQSALTPIIKRAITLAHLVRVQLAEYEYSLPSAGTSFDPAVMEDIADDGENEVEPSIRFATFPCLSKTISGGLAKPQDRQIVVKAKVLCQESEP